MNLSVVQVPVRIAPAFKKEVCDLIQTALDRGPPRWTAEHIFQDVLEEKVQLFVAIDDKAEIMAACTTQVDQYPLAKVLQIMQLGSKVTMDELQPLFKKIEQWAYGIEKCDYIEIFGREGWKKLLPDYSVRGIHLIKFSGD